MIPTDYSRIIAELHDIRDTLRQADRHLDNERWATIDPARAAELIQQAHDALELTGNRLALAAGPPPDRGLTIGEVMP